MHESVFPSHSFAALCLYIALPLDAQDYLRKQTETRHQHHHLHRHPNKLFVGNCVLLLKIESLYVVIHQFNVSCRRLWVSFLGVQLLVILSVCLSMGSRMCVHDLYCYCMSAVAFVSPVCWDKTVLSPDKWNQKSNPIVTCTHIKYHPSKQPVIQFISNIGSYSDTVFSITFCREWVSEQASGWVSVSACSVCVLYTLFAILERVQWTRV